MTESMALMSQKIQSFLSVVEHGTVHAAARNLRLTQTAVTRRLAGLEAELDATLFTRSRRGMELTDAGRALLTYSRQVLDLEGEALAKITGAETQAPSSIRIYGPSSVLRARVIPAVSEALGEFPKVTYTFQISDSESGVDALKFGACDFAVLERNAVVNEFASKALAPERYILVGPAIWKARSLADIIANERIVDFDPTDQMTFRLLAAHGLRDMARIDRHFVNNTDALAALVVKGFAYSVLTSEFAEELIKAGRLCAIGGRRHFDFSIALAWYPRKHLPEHFKAIIRSIR